MSDYTDNWINKEWKVVSAAQTNADPAVPDKLYFTPTMTIERHHGMDPVEIWAAACTWGSDDRLYGTTLDGTQTFVIARSDRTLACVCTDVTARRRQIRTVSLWTLLGTLVGLGIGFLTRTPVAGAMIGFFAALTGSAGTASSLAPYSRSADTWTAEDGSPGREIEPVRQPLKAVRA